MFSKSSSIKDTLLKLETKIESNEKTVKRLRMNLKNVNIKLQILSVFAVMVSIMYSYVNKKSILLPLVWSVIISYIVKYCIIYLYDIRISNIDSNIEILKEEQKEKIDFLKKQEAFDATKKLIDKYDAQSAKKDYFSKLKQREKSIIDNVTNIILGEDPSTMYALICKRCYYHNGLVHPNDDIAEFYCYNCNELNARSGKTNQ